MNQAMVSRTKKAAGTRRPAAANDLVDIQQIAPMRRAHFDPLLVGSIHPSADDTSAREDKRMLAIEGCGRDRLPCRDRCADRG
jgi:hypothetical protein